MRQGCIRDKWILETEKDIKDFEKSSDLLYGDLILYREDIQELNKGNAIGIVTGEYEFVIKLGEPE